MITFETINKSFGTKKVLQNLSLHVRAKEIVTLLGPNGCGKTTLLNVLAGLTKPDEGNVFIDNLLVNGKKGNKKVYLTPSERKIGYVFQTNSLFPHMRIQDNVAYGLKAMHLSKQETRSRSQKLLEFVELNEYAKHYPHQLSGGQKQRASLARSLATEPRVILLDEPVSAVDPEMKEPFRLELKSYLRKLEITTLYVTHNLSEAVVMSDRIAVMGNGHVEQIGCGHELFDKPTSNYVATFLGINAFKGKAVRSKGRLMEIRVNGTTLNATLEQSLIGKEIVATVKPESISLSKTPNEFSEESGINVMEGTIIEMTQMRSNAQITIDIGFTLKTRVPLSGVKALEIGIGENVYVNFEAKALNVFEDDHST